MVGWASVTVDCRTGPLRTHGSTVGHLTLSGRVVETDGVLKTPLQMKQGFLIAEPYEIDETKFQATRIPIKSIPVNSIVDQSMGTSLIVENFSSRLLWESVH